MPPSDDGNGKPKGITITVESGPVPSLNGGSVSGAGDVNGDGFGDLIISTDSADIDGGTTGTRYLIYGSKTLTSLSLSPSDNAKGITIQGAIAGSQGGRSVSDTGDVNGDGRNDFIVGAMPAAEDVGKEGASYLIFC